jgi:hypothetical protein
MDIGTGKIYPDRETAEEDMRAKGVPEKEINKRLIQGTRPTLRKLRKLIRSQWKREPRP